MVTKDSKLNFGVHKGKKLSNCPRKYLEWMKTKLIDTDFHEWAMAASEVLEARKADSKYDDLEAAADDFLRSHGINPKRI